MFDLKAPKSPEGDFAVQMQKEKELDEQIKTQLAKIGFEL